MTPEEIIQKAQEKRLQLIESPSGYLEAYTLLKGIESYQKWASQDDEQSQALAKGQLEILKESL